MTVQELIDKLAALPPDLELWQRAAYGTGVQRATINPKVETLCEHSSNGNPRYESSMKYVSNSGRWAPTRQVVAL